LLVEVADTTLKRDQEKKAVIYAKAGIIEYWVIDLNTKQVHIFRQSDENKYQQEIVLTGSTKFSLLAFPEIEVQIARLFS
jgi:Uma2 family endonuclease